MKIDFGKLTDEETKEIAIEAMNELSADDQIAVVKATIHKDNYEELLAQLQD